MRTASMETGVDLFGLMIPIEGIFHFVAIKIIFAIGRDGFDFDVFKREMLLFKGLGDEGLFLFEFERKIEDLPRGGGEKTAVFRGDAELGRGFNFGCDGFEIRRFFFSDKERGDGFAGQSIPEKNLFAIRGARRVGKGANSLAAGDEFFDKEVH